MRRLLAIPRLPHRLSKDEWLDCLRAQVAVLAAHAVLLVTPRGRFAELASPHASAGAAVPDPADLPRARALLRAVSRVARYGLTRPLCLARAVALLRLLRSENVRGAVLRVGVRREGDALRAHAWVELAGIALDGDPASLDSYVPLPDLSLARPRR
jgi:hypothetical protein